MEESGVYPLEHEHTPDDRTFVFIFKILATFVHLKTNNHPCVSISKIENRTQDLPLEVKINQIHGHMMHHSKHPWRGHHV